MKTNINYKIVQAISSETRIKIMEVLAKGEECACKLPSAVNKSQPAVSQHLAILRSAGLVRVRKEGAMMKYSLSEKGKKIVQDMRRW
ncbi:MAG: metalloregulator ArsR/SmtB family transcription factor [Candidatus Bilamarchaeaceae archaeon]